MTLEIMNLVQGYGSNIVLDDVSLTIPSGKMVSVLGPNGSGKSTLIKTICKVMEPKSGTIFADGRNITDIDGKEFATVVGYVPQKYIPVDYVQVFDAILMGRAPYTGWSYSKEDFRIASEAIELMGVQNLIEKNVHDLSGGQLQKVILARAITQQPQYYILDEPTSALDLRNQLNTLRTMKMMMSSCNAGVLVALHDLNLAIHFSDEVVMLKDGHVYADGPAEEVITEQSIKDVYGVDSEIVEGRGGKYVHICEDFDNIQC